MFPAKTIQNDMVDWASSLGDSKKKWSLLKSAWGEYAKVRKQKNNAIKEVVLQVMEHVLYHIRHTILY